MASARWPAAEPDQLVFIEYLSGGRVALINLNRPHADNAITTGEHWSPVVHSDRVEGISAFNEDGEPTFQDPDF